MLQVFLAAPLQMCGNIRCHRHTNFTPGIPANRQRATTRSHRALSGERVEEGIGSTIIHLANAAHHRRQGRAEDEEVGVRAHRPHVEDEDVLRQLLLGEAGDSACLVE